MNPLGHALAMALVDFVWQGAIIGVVLALGLRLLRRRSPQRRYTLCAAGLVALLALPVATTVSRYRAVSLPVPSSSATAIVSRTPNADVATIVAPSEPTEPMARLPAALEPWILPAWSFGVLLFALRLLAGAAEVRALRRSAAVADERFVAMVSRLARRMGVTRPVRIFTSDRTAGPSVIGWWRPVILLPPAPRVHACARRVLHRRSRGTPDAELSQRGRSLISRGAADLSRPVRRWRSGGTILRLRGAVARLAVLTASPPVDEHDNPPYQRNPQQDADSVFHQSSS